MAVLPHLDDREVGLVEAPLQRRVHGERCPVVAPCTSDQNVVGVPFFLPVHSHCAALQQAQQKGLVLLLLMVVVLNT